MGRLAAAHTIVFQPIFKMKINAAVRAQSQTDLFSAVPSRKENIAATHNQIIINRILNNPSVRLLPLEPHDTGNRYVPPTFSGGFSPPLLISGVPAGVLSNSVIILVITDATDRPAVNILC